MRTVLLSAALVAVTTALTAAEAQAQVIEIADDGTAQVLGGMTGSARSAVMNPRGRAGQFNYDESIARAAQTHRIDPALLHAVAWQESRGNNAAVSGKGALGIMQLMPGTAAALGVDPRDPEANINGGAAYLSLQLTRFGSVELALAAYNAGPGAVTKYGGVPPYRETQGYVSTIMTRWTGKPAALLASSAKPPQLTRRERVLPVLLIEVPPE